MKKTTKITALTMATILAMGSMTACGGDKEETKTPATDNGSAQATSADPVKMTLKVMAPQEEQTDYTKVDEKYTGKAGLLSYMCEQFNEAHPEWDITFEYLVCSEADADKQLSKDATKGGDVFMYAGNQVATLASNQIALPLAGAGLEDVKANNGEKAISAVTIDGMTYGIPFTPNTWFMYYDKSKYSEEEVKSLTTMMNKDIDGCKYNFAMDLDNGWYNGGFFYAAGCTVFGADGTKEDECDFNNENGLGAGKAMLALANNKKFLCDDDNNVAISEMAKGNCAALCSGTWNAAAIQEALGDNYAATKLPTIDINGKETQLNSIGDYKYIGVNANTENPEAAQALACWLGGQECQLDRFKARQISPTWKALTSEEVVAQDIATTALALQNQYTAVTPVSQKFNDNYWNAMAALGAGMVSGKITESNLQKQLDSVVENITTSVSE